MCIYVYVLLRLAFPTGKQNDSRVCLLKTHSNQPPLPWIAVLLYGFLSLGKASLKDEKSE